MSNLCHMPFGWDSPFVAWRWGDLNIAELDGMEPRERALLLIRQTIDYARRHAPYYRERVYRADTWEEFSALPLLPSDCLRSHARALACADVANADAVYLSGGTTAAQKRIESDLREETYLNAVRLLERVKDKPTWYEGPVDIEGRLVSNYHGGNPPIPQLARLRRFQLPLVIDSQWSRASATLSEYGADNSEEQIVTLRGQLDMIIALAAYAAVDQPARDRKFALRELRAGSSFATTRQTDFIESQLGARLRPMFGQTEFYQSYATRCLDCDYSHFLWTVYPEIIDMASLTPRLGVPGELIMTHLVPFALRQPLIRYQTGDMATEAAYTCRGRRSFAFIGRAKSCLIDPANPAVVVSPGEIKSELDEVAGIGRDLLPGQPDKSFDYGDPIVTVDPPNPGSGLVSLNIAVSEAWEDRVDSVVDEAAHRVRALLAGRFGSPPEVRVGVVQRNEENNRID